MDVCESLLQIYIEWFVLPNFGSKKTTSAPQSCFSAICNFHNLPKSGGESFLPLLSFPFDSSIVFIVPPFDFPFVFVVSSQDRDGGFQGY
jgi:hypothetical protein